MLAARQAPLLHLLAMAAVAEVLAAPQAVASTPRRSCRRSAATAPLTAEQLPHLRFLLLRSLQGAKAQAQAQAAARRPALAAHKERAGRMRRPGLGRPAAGGAEGHRAAVGQQPQHAEQRRPAERTPQQAQQAQQAQQQEALRCPSLQLLMQHMQGQQAPARPGCEAAGTGTSAAGAEAAAAAAAAEPEPPGELPAGSMEQAVEPEPTPGQQGWLGWIPCCYFAYYICLSCRSL